MKVLIGVTRIFVGILFIISGLIKLNDPVGFSFKLGDYFAPDVLNLPFLEPFALMIAVVVVIFEVILGVMLIIGYAKKFTLWSLFLMILFFTFLTFYSAYFNKVTDCGCFGDALKLTPWESFTKDIVLLVLIVFLMYGKKHLYPFFTSTIRSVIIFTSFILCLWLGYHVLMHLPIVDFRAYKVGTNIQEGMDTPPDAPKAVYEYNWKFNVNGQEKIVTNMGEDPKVDGELLGVETNVIQQGYEPPIHDFSIERDGSDFTSEILSLNNVLVVIAYNLDKAELDGFLKIKEATNKAIQKGYKVIGMSASSAQEAQEVVDKYKLNFDFYFCDMTALKTIIRSNPSIMILEKGTITQKVHWNDVDQLNLVALEGANPTLDFSLKSRLDSIGVLDQKYRALMQHGEGSNNDSLWEMQNLLDASNIKFVTNYFKTKGYPGKSVVGEPTNTVAWYVLQHSNQIETYLPIVKEAGKNGELPFKLVAMMEDRHLMSQNKLQVYGTQGMTYNGGKPFVWPIKDPENVNQRRKEAGFYNTVEDYAKAMFGEDFEYKVLTLEDIKQ